MRRLAVTACAVLVLAVLVQPTGARGTGSVVSGLSGPDAVAQYAKFEATATITPEPANPFDPAEIDVRGHFLGPGGQRGEIPGFWYQGYSRALVDGREVLAPEGEPMWKVRFSFPAPGAWTWWWTVRTPEGVTETAPREVAVTASDAPGFVRPSLHDPRYLAFDDGSPYFAVGENVGWYDRRGTFAYDSWYRRLADQGANYARLWMPSWAFGIEWADTGLGDYRSRMDRAWQLDHVVELGESLGIYQVLSLQNHGPFSQSFNSEWGANPYNAANGGPLDHPGEVFTDAQARELFERRFRYVVARWGYSTHLLAWELWNEVDHVTPYVPGAALEWHRHMADRLRALDPHDHLVSTSFAFGPSDGSVWAAAGMDYTQFHFYSRSFSDVPMFPDLAHDMTTWLPPMQRAFARPTLLAEFGVDARGPSETFAADPDGLGLHDGLWAPIFGETFGTGMTWWWDNYVDVVPERFYPMFGAVARFVEGTAWDREGFVRSPSVASSASRPVVLYGLQGSGRALFWLKDHAHQWWRPDPVEVPDARVSLVGLGPGAWCGAWWDTTAGAPVAAVQATGGVPTTVDAPSFVGDLGLRLDRC